MTSEQSALAVARRINQILSDKVNREVYALAKYHAEAAQQDFLDRQNSGQPSNGITPWKNETNQAMQHVKFRPYIKHNAIGFRGSHGMWYGVFLERKNDRKYEAIRPIVFRIGKEFLDDARKALK